MRSAPWLVTTLVLPVVFAANPVSDNFRADSTLVMVNVSVVDTHDRPVTSLREQHFRVFENGKEQPLAFFSHEDSPVSIGLIFDTSGSMDGKIVRARGMVKQLCEELSPEDEIFVVTVQKTARLAIDYTNECGDIQNALLFSKPAGLTPLLDAIPLALRHLKTAHNRRRAVLMISDGGDNASRISKNEIRRLAREAGAPIYAAALTTFWGHAEGAYTPEELKGPQLLRDVIEYSGGRYWEIEDSRSIADAAHMMAGEIHDQYVIGYRPPEDGRDGKYRRIAVKVSREGTAPRLSVSFRTGYYAPLE